MLLLVFKDQLKTAAPLEGGIGMHLLKKMGWLPGQGLGRKNEGPIEPLMLDIKFDKKGLVAEEETIKNLPLQLVSIQDGPGKHPVSMVQELCAKRKWDLPTYDLVSEEGPDHRKNFVFKVCNDDIDNVVCDNLSLSVDVTQILHKRTGLQNRLKMTLITNLLRSMRKLEM